MEAETRADLKEAGRMLMIWVVIVVFVSLIVAAFVYYTQVEPINWEGILLWPPLTNLLLGILVLLSFVGIVLMVLCAIGISKDMIRLSERS